MDSTTANQGYVTVGCVGDGRGFDRLKFQVRKGERTYNYDLSPTSDPTRYPMNMGSGSYRLRIMERVEGNRYAQVMVVDKRVRLVSPFVPYTIPTVFCDYDTQGPCFRVARYVVASCETDLDALDAVTKWVAGYVSYDFDKAKLLSAKSGYVPRPDATMRERKGVCFDYASMAAAMLRSMDVPCKVVSGLINSDTRHAWVSAYVGGKWRRRDPTFASVRAKMPQEYKSQYVY